MRDFATLLERRYVAQLRVSSGAELDGGGGSQTQHRAPARPGLVHLRSKLVQNVKSEIGHERHVSVKLWSYSSIIVSIGLCAAIFSRV